MNKLHAIVLFVGFGISACQKSAPEKHEPAPTPPPATEAPKPPKPEPQPKKQEPAPKNPGELSEGTDKQRQLLVQAKAALVQEDWERADAVFLELIKTEEMSGLKVTGYVALAQSLRDNDKPEEAIALLEQLKDIEFAEVQFVLARAYADAGETTRAMRAYERTIGIQSDYLAAYVELAGLYSKSGRKEESEKMFYEYEKKVYSYAKKLESLDTPPQERVHALEVFAFINDDRANQAIIRALADPVPGVRFEAVELVRELQLGSAAERVAEMATNDPILEVRMLAKEAAATLESAPTEGGKPTFKK